jgi:acetate kinase
MATRSGDVDPMIPLYLQEHAGYTADEVANILTAKSGLLGITGLRDVRDVLAAAGHPIPGWPRRRWTKEQRSQATLGLNMFLYDVQRYLASYLGLLGKVQAIIFTGAVGQNPWIRRHILHGVPAAEGRRVIVVPTDEEQAIAAALPK